MILGKFLKSKFAFFLSLFFLSLLLGSIIQKNSEQGKIDKEKNDLEKMAFEIENKNLELKKSLEYLSSSSSKEKIARSKLNLKKQGETIFSFSENSNLETLNNKKEEIQGSNFSKWLNYFSKPD